MEKDMLTCGCTDARAQAEAINEIGGSGYDRACRGYEGCGADSWGVSNYPLAMVYAPCQMFRALYDPATALSRGTLFTELDLPLGETDGCGFSLLGASCRVGK